MNVGPRFDHTLQQYGHHNMPPKSLQPSMGRSTSKPGPSLSKADKDSKAMPPPPAPKRILEEEMLALSGSFKVSPQER